MGQNIEISSNIAELKGDLETFRSRYIAVIETTVDDWLENAGRKATVLAPKDTGFLASTLKSLGSRIKGDILEGGLISSATYASYQEAKQPFIKPVVEESFGELIQALQIALNNLFEGDEN